MNQKIVDNIRTKFRHRFSTEPQLFRSPGRVNIIGEHTDYNNGFVLPAAIDKAIYIGISAREDNRIILYSEEFGQEHQTDLDNIFPSDKGWPNYILGVVDQLLKRGYALKGFQLNIEGDVPIGSGLSSSAAVECATAFALNDLFSFGINRLNLALIAQKAEHEFAKVMCGIMDQFASVFGKAGHVIRLDCQSLQYEYVPLSLEGYSIVLFNTNVKHSLASSAYNERRQQCEAGVQMIRERYSEVTSLRDATLAMVNECIREKDEIVYRRCKYVVEEKERLLSGCEDLINGDLAALGKKMFRTHDGLSKEYEVSCPELDFLVDAVRNHPKVTGARMMGGGFGGCTINIIESGAIDSIAGGLSKKYEAAMNLPLTVYIAQTDDGTSKVS